MRRKCTKQECIGHRDGTTTVAGLSYGYADGLNLTGITDTVTAAYSLTLWNDNVGELTQANGPWGVGFHDREREQSFHILFYHAPPFPDFRTI